MPQITYKELIEKQDSILFLMKGQKIDPYANFRLRKFLAAARDAIVAVEAHHNELVKEYGKETKEGSGVYQVPKEKMADFTAAKDKILTDVVTLPDVTIKIREIAGATMPLKCPKCGEEMSRGIEGNDILNLDFILDQEDDTPYSKIVQLPTAAGKNDR